VGAAASATKYSRVLTDRKEWGLLLALQSTVEC